MLVGIEKIKEAEIELKKLNEDLAIQKVKVIKRTEEVESLLKEIADGTAEASEKKELAIIKSKEIEEQTKVIDKEKVINKMKVSIIRCFCQQLSVIFFMEQF